MSGAPQMNQSCCYRVPWIHILRICGGVCGGVLIIIGIIIFFSSGLNVKAAVLAIYRIVFGILIILAELRLQNLLRWFAFLTHYVGIGMFYIFVGGLALGDEWWEYILAGVCWAVGLMYIILVCCCTTIKSDQKVPPPTRMNEIPKENKSVPTSV